MKNLITPLAAKAAVRKSAETTAQEWLPDSTGRGSGRLLLRCKSGSGHWYFRYTRPDGRDDKYPIGSYTEPSRSSDTSEVGGGYSISQARDRADELAAMLKHPATADIRATFERRARETLEAEDAEAAKRDAAQAVIHAQQKYTLGALMEIYCKHLEDGRKASAKDVRALVTRHLLRDQPELASRPAHEVSRSELAKLLRTLVEGGKKRTAGLLRAYLNAAYRLAQSAEGDATAPSALIPFNIDRNPVDGIKSIAVKKRDRVLTDDELRYFLKRLSNDPGAVAALVRSSLYAGGQRPQQMLRTELKNFSAKDRTLLLMDGKGKRAEARAHLVPLGSLALKEIKRLAVIAKAFSTPLLFTSNGEAAVQLTSMGKWIREMRDAMMAAKEIQEPFQMKDLRRTVETMLAKLGADTDTRAQVLSHGLSGIQSSVYNQHDYLAEKRRAMSKWDAHLLLLTNGKPAHSKAKK